MPKIVIREIDETTAGSPAASTDIVFIPGFAATNSNVIIYNTAGGAPSATTNGSTWQEGDTVDKAKDDDASYPTIATNIATKQTWHCTGTEPGTGNFLWSLVDSYEAPHPENAPMLCSTITEFESYFGEMPYRFTDASSYPSGFSPAPVGNFYEVGDFERSYLMAKELIYAGLPVLYANVVVRDDSGAKASPTPSAIYDGLEDILTELQDKGEYTVKYLTSGAYPVFEYNNNALADKMISTAKERGDCVALIDHTNIPYRTLKPDSDDSVYSAVKAYAGLTQADTNRQFGTMFTPWGIYSIPNAPSESRTQILPASFAYLISLAISIRNNPNWLAIAGVTRGQVPYLMELNTTERLSNTIADAYQPRDNVSINAITNIKPYGLTIWGNRTLFDNSKAGNLRASSFLNTRNMISDVKKVAYTAAKRLIFEQDSNILWLNFKAAISPTLDQMLSGYGISGYKIIRGTTTEKAKVVAIIKLYPTFAVEDFDITVVMSDQEVTVS